MITNDKLKHNSQLIVELAESALHNLRTDEIHRYKHNMGEAHFRDQFRTVRLHLPRRSGHTTAALQLVVNHPGSLLFVERETAKMDALRMLREYTDNSDVIEQAGTCIVPIYNPNRILALRPQPHRDFIVFDQTNEFKQESVEAIIRTLNAEIVVILQ